VDARAGCGFEGFGCGFDVFAFGAGQRGDPGAADLFGDGEHRFEITGGGDGEAGFEDVNAEAGDLVRHAELFSVVHGAAGGLLAVAERGVEEDDLIAVRHSLKNP